MTDQAPAQPVTSPKLGLMDYVKLLWNGRPALQELIAQGKIVEEAAHTAGIKTAGFWLVVLVAIGAVAAQLGGVLPPPYGLIVMTSGVGLYQMARGIQKMSDELGGLKPVFTTSEGLLGLIATVVPVLAAVKGIVSPQAAATLASVSAGLVAVSQSMASAGAQPGDVAAIAEALSKPVVIQAPPAQAQEAPKT